ncbi:MAG: ATP-binding protein [Burkholderiales bacterium]|nr:MAG: ATP-binding protein [Burkholderiales bacterium]
MSLHLHAANRPETLPSALRGPIQAAAAGVVPSRYASRFLERTALQERLASGPVVGEAFPPPARLDTARIMAAIAPLLVPDTPGCFVPAVAPDVSVRRMLAPLPGGRSLAIDVVPATVRFEFEDLARLLGELVDNACRHAPAGATVRVRGAPGLGGYQISVTNPGAPLPRWALAALRPGRPATGVGDPTGLALGLPIAALLAAVNGARLEVLRGAGRPNTLRVIARLG